jgi:uncharacterized protein YgbK (DUF1537 family)
MPACLLIADDLTGACDAAVHFAMRGHRTLVSLDPRFDAPGAGALALSTESRSLCPQELRAVFAGLGGAGRGTHRFGGSISWRPLLFNKIDSTLRGSVGAEIAMAAEAFACESALITPAFPAMGRTVESGVLRVSDAAFHSIELATYWSAQGLCGCAHVPPGGVEAALAAGTRFISVDASTDRDLDAIAAAGLASARRILWAGSAGLASALARAVGPGPHTEPGPPERHAAALFCIGSDHPVTIEQQRQFAAARPVAALDAEMAEPDGIAQAFHDGMHVALQVPYGRIAPERVRRLIGDWRGPLVLSGGATASLVCRALGVREILLDREIAPGIPRGAISGGLFDGMPIVTKSGGFGKPGALIQIADDLTCPT